MGVQWHRICQHEGAFQNVKQLLISESEFVLYNKHELLFLTADISCRSQGWVKPENVLRFGIIPKEHDCLQNLATHLDKEALTVIT